MTALSHMEALNTRLAAEQAVVPLRLPVSADEWNCHAPTTIRDAAGEVLAECSGHGRHSVEDEAIAAEIVRRVNVHEELLAALQSAAQALGANSTILEDFAARLRSTNALVGMELSGTAGMLRYHADVARAAIARATGAAA